MAKKLIKYGKLLMSMALIFCMLMPSYASLSASDGSAFVSKSEFDSAMADFNARLTTFEAGINSKIDSQVTSYIDRNGIWSGKTQVFNTAKLGETGIQGGGAATWGTYWYNNGSTWKDYENNSTTAKNRFVLTKNPSTTTSANIITEFSKSGLLLLQVEAPQKTDADARRGICVMSGNSASSGGNAVTVYADYQTLNFTENVNFIQVDNSVSPAIEELKSGIALPHIVPVPGVAALSDYPKSFVKFFVKKGTGLKATFDVTLNVINVVGHMWYVKHEWYVRSAIVY